MFQIAKLTSGKGATQAHAVKHPTTGKLIVSQEEIKSVSIKFCQAVLEKNEPTEEFKDMVELKKYIHKKRMKTWLNLQNIYTRKE